MQVNAKVMHNGIKICAEKVQSRKFLEKGFLHILEYQSSIDQM